VQAWYWESVDLGQKLFLTSLIAFIAPHSAVQVIVAAMFAFVMLLLAVQVKPYRDRPNNQLLALSQINIFLFLWTVRLLAAARAREDPDSCPLACLSAHPT
jgi:hypothetical protein